MIPPLQYLRHGKALCGKVFRSFVETFNFHNDFIANLKGDGDLPVSDGIINVDRTDPTHPVIRLNKQKLEGFDAEGRLPGFFEIVRTEEEGTVTIDFEYPYYQVGTRIYECTEAISQTFNRSGFYYLHVDLGSGGPQATVSFCETMDDMIRIGDSPETAVRPLYEVDMDGNVVRDLRNIPTVVAQEY